MCVNGRHPLMAPSTDSHRQSYLVRGPNRHTQHAVQQSEQGNRIRPKTNQNTRIREPTAYVPENTLARHLWLGPLVYIGIPIATRSSICLLCAV
jgi:hypothetical protein